MAGTSNQQAGRFWLDALYARDRERAVLFEPSLALMELRDAPVPDEPHNSSQLHTQRSWVSDDGGTTRRGDSTARSDTSYVSSLWEAQSVSQQPTPRHDDPRGSYAGSRSASRPTSRCSSRCSSTHGSRTGSRHGSPAKERPRPASTPVCSETLYEAIEKAAEEAARRDAELVASRVAREMQPRLRERSADEEDTLAYRAIKRRVKKLHRRSLDMEPDTIQVRDVYGRPQPTWDAGTEWRGGVVPGMLRPSSRAGELSARGSRPSSRGSVRSRSTASTMTWDPSRIKPKSLRTDKVLVEGKDKEPWKAINNTYESMSMDMFVGTHRNKRLWQMYRNKVAQDDIYQTKIEERERMIERRAELHKQGKLQPGADLDSQLVSAEPSPRASATKPRAPRRAKTGHPGQSLEPLDERSQRQIRRDEARARERERAELRKASKQPAAEAKEQIKAKKRDTAKAVRQERHRAASSASTRQDVERADGGTPKHQPKRSQTPDLRHSKGAEDRRRHKHLLDGIQAELSRRSSTPPPPPKINTTTKWAPPVELSRPPTAASTGSWVQVTVMPKPGGVPQGPQDPPTTKPYPGKKFSGTKHYDPVVKPQWRVGTEPRWQPGSEGFNKSSAWAQNDLTRQSDMGSLLKAAPHGWQSVNKSPMLKNHTPVQHYDAPSGTQLALDAPLKRGTTEMSRFLENALTSTINIKAPSHVGAFGVPMK